jgi:hypothetical protein
MIGKRSVFFAFALVAVVSLVSLIPAALRHPSLVRHWMSEGFPLVTVLVGAIVLVSLTVRRYVSGWELQDRFAGKRRHVPWQQLTERAQRAVYLAQEEAVRLGEYRIGTEHLLLGLIRESDCLAALVLGRLGVPLDGLRAEVGKHRTQASGKAGQETRFRWASRRAIELAHDEALALGDRHVGTEHLLIGLMREQEGLAARVLVSLGTDVRWVRREVHALRADGVSEPAAA